jgi:hypothetical protein
MKTSRFVKFIRPVAVAVALAITTVSIPAQPASAMTQNECSDLANAFRTALDLGDFFYGLGAGRAAIFQYQRAEAIAEAYGELCS